MLWAAAAIDPNGARHWGLGCTPGEAKAFAWAASHLRAGMPSLLIEEVSPEVPDSWTFELYPPPEPREQILDISFRAIFELVRLSIPDVTLDEVADTIVESFPYIGGPLH